MQGTEEEFRPKTGVEPRRTLSSIRSVGRRLPARFDRVAPRIALYSHDTMGLGHMRRNILIAQALSKSPLKPIILLIAGARRATAYRLPPGTDCLTLPALRKEPDGKYRSRRLDVTLRQLIDLRARTIRAALQSFEPDLFVVDNVPRGAVRELDPTLEDLRREGRTRCVLGLRDVLDDPAAVDRDWTKASNVEAIEAFYDEVWVYGDPAVYDLVKEYRLCDAVAGRVRYTGYLDQRPRLELHATNGALGRLRLPPGRLALCLAGGGQDGGVLAEAFARAELPPGFNGVIITGPFMDRGLQGRLRRLADDRPRLRVIEFVPEPMQFQVHADRIVSMGGYNTTCEALSLGKRALIVPRVRPRTEQLIRASSFRDLGLLEVLHPDELTPGALSRWLASNGGPPPAAAGRIDFRGLERLPGLVEDALASSRDSEREGVGVAG